MQKLQLIPETKRFLLTSDANTMDLMPKNNNNNNTTASMIPVRVSKTSSSSSSSPRNTVKTNTNTTDTKKRKKVRVYLLMGQSNMVGFGTVSNDAKKKYPFFTTKDTKTNKSSWKRILLDDNNNEAAEDNDNNTIDTDTARFRRRVRYVYAAGSEPGSKLRIEKNMWLTMKNQKAVGPEIGIGYELGMATTMDNNDDFNDILLLKSCE